MSNTLQHSTGLCYLNLGELDKSKEYFHRTIQLSRNQDAYEKLASIFAIENNYKNAISILITASKFVIFKYYKIYNNPCLIKSRITTMQAIESNIGLPLYKTINYY